MLSINELNGSEVPVLLPQVAAGVPTQFEKLLVFEFPARITAARASEPTETSTAIKAAASCGSLLTRRLSMAFPICQWLGQGEIVVARRASHRLAPAHHPQSGESGAEDDQGRRLG
jgi:hypothetical protein